jgi:hypothetical protein
MSLSRFCNSNELKCLLCTGSIPMKPTSPLHKWKIVVIFKKTFPVIPNRYLSFITGKIYNNEFFVNVMPMEGSSYIFKKPTSIIGSRFWQATCTTTTNKFPRFLCLCSLVRLHQTFRVWWSWVGIINYTWILLSLLHGGAINKPAAAAKSLAYNNVYKCSHHSTIAGVSSSKPPKVLLWRCFKWCHVAPWKFRLRFEPSGLPSLIKGDV